ncbi:MAG: 16S rRNA (guanine(527)-N(7))-methyltransferase RsmG [Acidimicrobiia bacterium]
MEHEAELLAVLASAQSRGFLGPGDPVDHLRHAQGFVEAAESHLEAPPARFVDLGTGGGVPGLVLAACWPAATGALVESSTRRCDALGAWVRQLGMEDRVRVLCGRAEVLAHESSIREQFDVTTARSFARPCVTAEIASGFVRVGGLVVVSEPPQPSAARWPPGSLEQLGFGPAGAVVARGAHYACLRKVRSAASSQPRRGAGARKRPLW